MYLRSSFANTIPVSVVPEEVHLNLYSRIRTTSSNLITIIQDIRSERTMLSPAPDSPTTNPVAILTQDDTQDEGLSQQKKTSFPGPLGYAKVYSANASQEPPVTDSSTERVYPIIPAAPEPTGNTTQPVESKSEGARTETEKPDNSNAQSRAVHSSVQPASAKPAVSSSLLSPKKTNRVEKVSMLPPQVQAILARARKSKNFSEELFADDLPSGWILHIHDRSMTQDRKHIDRYWFSPKTGKRLRSKPELNRFFAHLKSANGDEDIAWAMLTGKAAKKSTPRKREASSVGVKDSDRTRKRSKRTSSKTKSDSTTSEGVGKKSSSRREKTSEMKSIPPSKASKSSMAKTKVIAESKTTPARRKKIASKKSSSTNPFEITTNRNPGIPQIAESK